MRRPTRAAMRSMTRTICSASRKRTSVRSSLPNRSTYTLSGPLTRMSLTAGSASSGASGPMPIVSSVSSSASRTRSASLSADFLRGNRPRREILHGRRDVGAVVLEQPAFADLVQQPLLQAPPSPPGNRLVLAWRRAPRYRRPPSADVPPARRPSSAAPPRRQRAA